MKKDVICLYCGWGLLNHDGCDEVTALHRHLMLGCAATPHIQQLFLKLECRKTALSEQSAEKLHFKCKLLW